MTGDPTIDWAIDLSERRLPEPEERLTSEARVRWHRGGALLLHSLVREALNDFDVHILGFREDSPNPPSPDDRTAHHSFNTLQQFETKDRPTITENGHEWRSGWRISQYLGFQSCTDLAAFPREECEKKADTRLIVIDDAGLGFGNDESLWPNPLRDSGGSPPWILLKLHQPSISGGSGLWKRIAGADNQLDAPPFDGSRVIIVVGVDSLRDSGAEVSRGLSWERSSQDILAELKRNSNLRDLKKCQRLIVSFGPTGALLVDRASQDSESNDEREPKATLYFDKGSIEGDWERNEETDKEGNYRGRMFGYNQVLVASIAQAICSLYEGENREPGKHAVNKALTHGIGTGLANMRAAYDAAFGTDEAHRFRFPVECMDRAVREFQPGEARIFLGEAGVAAPAVMGRSSGPEWSIMSDAVRDGDSAYHLAKSVARQGPSVLQNIPLATFSLLLAVDRKEIEGLRALQNLVLDYWKSRDKVKPRSIGVFGSPGDGKSFAVKQVVEHLQHQAVEPLEFNLSQFNGIDDFMEALHGVRDRSLKGQVPLVLWDEFDASLNGERLGWLRHFLSPMQDGTFQQGQVTHPIGRAIFVFAGGTSKTYEEFRERVERPDSKDSKGVDFLSRLRGYLNVTGPNTEAGEGAGRQYVYRALLLNNFLERVKIRKDEGHLCIEEDVLDAFLTIDEYRHGARSMEAIVDMSTLHQGGRFGRSSLPPETQLNLHVNAKEFMHIARHEGWSRSGQQ
ncbi:hypothetical protein ACH4E5_25575 [Streptomyces afghaniensis]|uniref:hypothetical protein n=1 Tax=Streptomyces afghaniensis TaxID=66865 RepID=UPI0037A9D7E9